MKIGIYASARNEESNLVDWLASTEGADVIAVNDTGSSDKTFERFAAKAGKRLSVTQIPIEPMWLSNALNTSMAQLPDDIDLAIRLDLDERLQPGWREAIEAAWNGRTTPKPLVVPMWFDNDGGTYLHTRCHSRHGFQWIYPVHEVLADEHGHCAHAHDYVPCIETVPSEATIEHHQDPTKDRSQVLGELEAAYAAEPTNPRWMHYLGREYTYRAEWSRAIPLLRLHVESFDFAEQCSESWRLLGDCYRALMPIADMPLTPYRSAAAVAPQRREGWVKLAELCMEQDRWPESFAAAEQALTITERNWYLNWPFCWGGMPWHLAALAASKLDKHEAAIRYGTQAIELEPGNDLYRSNLDWYLGVSATVRN